MDLPNKAKHAAGDEHVARHLTAHSSEEKLLLAGFGMKRRVVDVLGLPELSDG